jgi:hypothetical protein
MRGLIIAAFLAAAGMAQQIHVQPGGTKITSCSFGEPPADPDSPANQARFKAVQDYVARNGFPGKLIVNTWKPAPLPIAGCDNPPEIPYIQALVSDQPAQQFDYKLVLKSPEVFLIELEEAFQFGNPSVITPFFEPVVISAPPAPVTIPVSQPANPIGAGVAGAPGIFFPAPGDASPEGTVFNDGVGGSYKKECRTDPFGKTCWWKKE